MFIVDDGIYNPITLLSSFCTASRNYRINISGSNREKVVIDGGARWENDDFWHGALLSAGTYCIEDKTKLGDGFNVAFNNMTFQNCNGVAYFNNTNNKVISQCIAKNIYGRRAFRANLVQHCVIENLNTGPTFRGALLEITNVNNCHISKILCNTLLENQSNFSRCIVDNLSCASIATYNRNTYLNLFSNLCLTATSWSKLWNAPRDCIIGNTFHIAKTAQTSQILFNNLWNVGDPLKRIVANNIVIGNVIMTTAPSSVYSNNYCRTVTQGSGSPAPISCIQGTSVDPKFKDIQANDFHLLPDSPFAHKGTSEFLSATGSTDLNGAKFNVHAPSMGCYEANLPTNPNMPSKYFPFGFDSKKY